MKDHVSAISLRLRDPVRDVGALLESWGLEVRHSWIAGTPRVTPSGTALTGVRPESYGTARLPLAADHRLRSCLRDALDALASASADLVRFVESGGTAEFFIAWNFEGNSGDTLDWQLLRRLADLRIALSLDIYPPDKSELEDTDHGQA